MSGERGRIIIIPPDGEAGLTPSPETATAGGGKGVRIGIGTGDSGDGGEKGPGGLPSGEFDERELAALEFVFLWLSKKSLPPDDAPLSAKGDHFEELNVAEGETERILQSSFLPEASRHSLMGVVRTAFSSGRFPDDLLSLGELGIDYTYFTPFINYMRERINPGTSALEGNAYSFGGSLNTRSVLQEARQVFAGAWQSPAKTEKTTAAHPLGIFEQGEHLPVIEEAISQLVTPQNS